MFQLHLALLGGANSRMLLGIDHLDRSSNRCVVRAGAELVLVQSCAKVIGFANVVRSVSATKDIDERHPTTMPSSECELNGLLVPFDSRSPSLRLCEHSLRTTIRLMLGGPP